MTGQILWYSAFYVLIGVSFVVVAGAIIYWREAKNSAGKREKRNWRETSKNFLKVFGFALLWPFVLGSGVWTLTGGRILEKRRELREEQERNKPWLPSPAQLQVEMSIAEAEESGIVHDPLGAVPSAPFGHLNRRWTEFREGLPSDTKVWWFDTIGQDRWKRDHIAKGYALRKGNAVGRVFLVEFRPVDLYDREESVRLDKANRG